MSRTKPVAELTSEEAAEPMRLVMNFSLPQVLCGPGETEPSTDHLFAC